MLGAFVGAVLVSVLATAPAEAKWIRPGFFGMHDQQISSGSMPTVSLGSVRLWDSATSWRQIETSPGVFSWGTTDGAVNHAIDAGLRPLLVLGQTPSFYASDPGASGLYGEGATSMPRRMTFWKRYVAKVAARYGNTVDYQVWNEPNVVQFWTGSVRQMAKLTAVASRMIHQNVHHPTVVAPSFVLRLNQQRRWYKSFWKTSVGGSMASYVDVVSANLYPSDNAGPEGSSSQLEYAMRALPKAARRLPIWNTEINFSYDHALTQGTQAAFTSRILLLDAASPIKRMYWYAWGWDFGAVDLVDPDRTSLTPAGRAWNTTYHWLIGTNMKSCHKTEAGLLKGVYSCTAVTSRTRARTFYWKPTGPSITLRTPHGTRSWTDLTGNTTTRNGQYRITVGRAPVMVSGTR